jgi:hypothetical protein
VTVEIVIELAGAVFGQLFKFFGRNVFHVVLQ